MALTKNVNAYVTAEEADTYFGDRLVGVSWSDADSTQKEQALVTATEVLDGLDWIGVAEDAEQPLCFPRVGDYEDPRSGQVVVLSGVPKRITTAVCLLAEHLLSNPDVLTNEGSLSGLSVSSLSLQNIREAPLIPELVHREIKPLLQRNTGSWWRAN